MLLIQPQYLTLAKLCDGRLFHIPEYQRAYSWTDHQRHDLFEDIRKTHERGGGAGHFMAAVVCLRRGTQALGTDEFHVMEVVDGQQRLTTLIMLMNAIKLSLDCNERSEKKLHDELSDLLVKEGDELLLLQTNHDSSHYFANFLRKGDAPDSKVATTLADRELLAGIEGCLSFVENWKKRGESLLSLAALLKNRLYFLLHEIDDEQTVYTVFEVLNSRGLDVSWLDRLKSILMGAAFELKNANAAGVINDLHTIWRDIYSRIGLKQGMSTEALRYAATLRQPHIPSRLLSEQSSVELLRDQASAAKTIREVANALLQVTEAYDKVIGDIRINAVTRISQARLLATAIHMRTDLEPLERQSLLEHCEKVSFRIYGMMRNDARMRVGDYVRLAWQVANGGLSTDGIHKAITTIGREFPVEEAVASLRNKNCYEGWENELRYLLYRYEEHLAMSEGLNFSNEQWKKIWLCKAADSIEHIWPRSKAPRDQQHRLGNLVLLPPKLNSKLKDRIPSEKLDDYRKTGLLITGDVADWIKSGTWGKKSIDARENEILEWAMEEWRD